MNNRNRQNSTGSNNLRANQEKTVQGKPTEANASEMLKNAGINTENISEQKTQALFDKLSPEQKQKLNSILNDKEATKRLLATPQAQALLRSLSGKANPKN